MGYQSSRPMTMESGPKDFQEVTHSICKAPERNVERLTSSRWLVLMVCRASPFSRPKTPAFKPGPVLKRTFHSPSRSPESAANEMVFNSSSSDTASSTCSKKAGSISQPCPSSTPAMTSFTCFFLAITSSASGNCLRLCFVLAFALAARSSQRLLRDLWCEAVMPAITAAAASRQGRTPQAAGAAVAEYDLVGGTADTWLKLCRGRMGSAIEEANIGNNGWYMAADPANYPVFLEVATCGT
mmetsp:Transcript_60824/g.113745  ORF Transcript_60824/g.113745 Transcript_60824/m.113745 type:complete len:241 (-) Transcript_60824:3-725(-)